MASDPWAMFRSPETNSANLIQNDAPAIASNRATVPSTSRAWGDSEAINAGLYEIQQDPWAAFKTTPQNQQPLAPTPNSVVEEDFSALAPPENDKLAAALKTKAMGLTRGPMLSPVGSMNVEAANLLPAASQGTNPNIDRYAGKLVSSEVFEDDSGSVMFRDPATGQVVPTDSKKHVAIRDPADGAIKIFSRSEDTNESGVVGAARVLAPGLAAGAVTARPGIAMASKVQPKASDIFSTAKPYYREFTKEAGAVVIPAEASAGFAERIRGALDKANFIEELATPVYKAAGILEKGDTTLDAMQNVKRVIGRSFSSPDKNVRDAAAVASREIAKIISEVSPSAAKSLKTGDDIHSTARAVQDLQRKSDIAGLRTGRAGYGGNAVNSMRQVLSPIVQKAIEGKNTGFKPNEIAAMREIVEGTTATNRLREVGAMSPTKGNVAIAMGGVTLGLTSAIGAGANKLAAVMTGKQIEKLKELVAKRSPAYSAGVSKAVERWERAQAAVASDPSPNKMGAYISASRALSAGLMRDGIQVTSGDFIRQLQGPMRAAAENDEQEVPGLPSQ